MNESGQMGFAAAAVTVLTYLVIIGSAITLSWSGRRAAVGYRPLPVPTRVAAWGALLIGVIAAAVLAWRGYR